MQFDFQLQKAQAATPNSAAGGRGLCNRPEASDRG
jgi:hypothetical protein